MESPQTHGLSILAIPAEEVATQDVGDPEAMVLICRPGSGLVALG